MKKTLLSLLLIFIVIISDAQITGDTIKVRTFNYLSNTRDSIVSFPNSGLTFEKIIMKYSMRCKNGLISTQSLPNQGCGEWDYSCNTYVVDSSQIENELNTTTDYVITNFSGTTFNYVTQPLYDYYNFNQTNVTLNTIVSETQYTVGLGNTTVATILKGNEKSGKSHLLYTAAELTAAGLTAGNIDGILLNVANSGGGVNFFNVGLKNSASTSLNSNSVTLTGFTNVYNGNYSFTNGSNRIQFYTPFVWDGTSNVLIEFYFTNTNPTNPIIFNGTTEATTMTLFANNNYAVDLSSGYAALNATMLASINTEMSLSIWAYGNSVLLPSNTSLFNATATDPSQRQFGVHLPWSDNNVYFDCGYSGGGYDRINKAALATEQGGKWNHWTFTKNATSGSMKVYLNGVLWHSGTSLTKVISILNFMLGSNDPTLRYKGKVNELTIWNKELALTDIQNWMNKSITVSHPFYSNLVGYYPMNEGSGLNLSDTKNSLTSTAVNIGWSFERGDKLSRMFYETNERPNLVFLSGTYSLTTSTITTTDSIIRIANVVNQYSISSNATVTPMKHDSIAFVSTVNAFETTPLNIYNGDTGVLTGTIAVAPTGTINITTMNYYKRYPFFNEIMSFVTPYGKGLDLGMAGKTWYYDVTDFTPILKGKKHLIMTLGGQYQEQMDIEFLFIVGTPPRTILEFKQLWQGGGRDGSSSIANIINNNRFNVLNVPIHGSGQTFKMRSTITGHGSEGEFQQNGGVVNHYINVNGGANEFSWSLNKICSANPIFPQGGTWLYNRQGWCPGLSSTLKEMNITPYVTPGSTVTIDYNCSNPSVAAGSYNYIVANQLVTYGGANFALDANIQEILAPTDKVLYSRINPMCARPMIRVQNTGSTTITSLEIDYWLNNSSTKQTYIWTGNLLFMDTTRIILPLNALWQTGLQPSANIFHAELTKANGSVDQYLFNNSYQSAFTVPPIIPSNFSVELRTNNYPTHNPYKIIDDNGNIIVSKTFAAANTTYIDNYTLNGCYTLIVTDSGNDGLSWWANTGQGTGFCRLKNSSSAIIKTFQPDFGSRFEYSFTTNTVLSIDENEFATNINIYPNPATDRFIVEGSEVEGSEIKITNLLGQNIELPMIKNSNVVEFKSTTLVTGVYFIIITKNGNKAVKKIVIY